MQDVEGWLESGAEDRVRSYFSNLVVQQLDVVQGGGWFQRALLIVSETRFEGIFVYVLIVKLVHLFILFFTHITQ